MSATADDDFFITGQDTARRERRITSIICLGARAHFPAIGNVQPSPT
jgi:hypothetical protein